MPQTLPFSLYFLTLFVHALLVLSSLWYELHYVPFLMSPPFHASPLCHESIKFPCIHSLLASPSCLLHPLFVLLPLPLLHSLLILGSPCCTAFLLYYELLCVFLHVCPHPLMLTSPFCSPTIFLQLLFTCVSILCCIPP